MREQAAWRAANWWGDQLQVEGKQEALARAIATRLIALDNPRADSPDAYRMLLVKIEVDYDPCDLLLECLDEVGIECRGCMFSARGIFPEKYRMRIFEDEHIEVSRGYGAPRETIYPFPEDSR